MVYVFLFLALFVVLLLLFAAQKVVFLVANARYAAGLTAGDWLAVVQHGVPLDVSAACVLMAVPVLLMAVSLVCPRMNLRRALSIYCLPAALAVSLIFVADTVLYGFWGAKLDAADLMYAENPKDVFASLTLWESLLGLLAVAVCAAACYFSLRCAYRLTLRAWEAALARSGRRPLRGLWQRIATGAALALLLGGCFVGLRGGTGAAIVNPGYAFFSTNRFLNHAALNPAFNLAYTFFQGEQLEGEFQCYGEEESLRLTQGIYEPHADIADTLLRCRRPNIVLVIWEGGGCNMVCDGRVAPFYQRLRREGVYFDSCYANGHRTDRGVVSILSGWPSLPNHSVMKRADLCPFLPSLARTLARAGYHTEFLYTGDLNFTNMQGYLYETGFQKARGTQDYRDAAVRNNWGAADEFLLRMDARLPEQPFFHTYLTLSSHESWEVPYHRLEDKRENAFAYTDSCLYAFVGQLRSSPLWDSLLLIVVPDHGVAATDGYAYTLDVAHIPMLWIGGAVRRPCVVGALMNQSDLAATLLAQLGLPFGDFPFSRNVLSRQPRRPVAAHCYKNGLNLIAASAADSCGTASSGYECVDGRVLPLSGDTSAASQALARALLQRFYSVTAALPSNRRTAAPSPKADQD